MLGSARREAPTMCSVEKVEQGGVEEEAATSEEEVAGGENIDFF